MGAQWLSGRVLDSRPMGRGFEPHRRHFVVSLSKNINPSLVLVQPRKTRPFITERLLMGRKKSNQTNTEMAVSRRTEMTAFPCSEISPLHIVLRVGCDDKHCYCCYASLSPEMAAFHCTESTEILL